MKRRLVATGALTVIGAVAAADGAALAQEPVRGQSVLERPRPGYDPLGVRVGGFLIHPQAVFETRYDDNIYATENNEVDDFIFVISPSIQANSDWNNHELNFFAGSDIGLYADHTDEDFLDARIGTSGRLDITRANNLFGGASYSRLHEDRGDPNAIRAATEPVEYNQLDANAGYFHRLNRLTARLTGTYRHLDFDNVPLTTGEILDNSVRDRSEYATSLRLGYDVGPGWGVFVRGTYNWRDYRRAINAGGVNRDSEGYEIVAGATLDLTGVTSAEVFAGYLRQEYDDPALRDIDGPSFGAAVLWNVTGLTSVRGYAQRTVQETITAGASGFLQTQAGVSVEHELLRNLILLANFDYANNDYDGIDRKDNIYTAGAGARYFLNRNIFLGADYRWRQRDSDVAGLDYTRNIVSLRIGGQL